MKNTNTSSTPKSDFISHYAGDTDTIPLHMKIMNHDYNPKVNTFDYCWDDKTVNEFFEAFIMDSLQSLRDCTPGTEQHSEVKQFIFSESFLFYCDALNLNGKELQNGVRSILVGNNFCDSRDSLSLLDSSLHHIENELAAEKRRVKYIS